MFLSIIVGYRNRELFRIENALNSLVKQTSQNFELIFIDYGSDALIAHSVESLINKYAFAQYYYTDTRGWFWNRAHALNTGIRLAKGEIILLFDIDLILEEHFVEKLVQLDFSKQFFTFSCFYLPENFTIDYQNIQQKGIHYEQNYVGLCAFTRESIQHIYGFDEYYMVWGVEDDDLYSRLEQSSVARKHLTANEFGVFHQWHPTQRPGFPSFWYITMVNYWHQKNASPVLPPVTNWGQVVTNRLLPEEVAQILPNHTIVFEGDILYRYNQLSLFLLGTVLQAPSTLCIHAYYTTATAAPQASFKRWLFKSNQQHAADNPMLLQQKDMEMIQYFIGCNRQRIADYRLQITSQQLRVYLIVNPAIEHHSKT